MPEPVTLAALGAAIGKLLLRWTDLNDTADAVEDAKVGFGALRALQAKKAIAPVNTAITDQLKQRLVGVRDQDRREGMTIAVANVADLFTGLSDDDIRAAAQHPQGFPDYLTRGPGRTLLAHTEEAITPFTEQVIASGAEVFAQLAPRSGRFAAAALVRLLDEVDTVLTGVAGLHEQIADARAELVAAADRVAERVEALHPKVDAILQATQRPEGAVDASLLATRDGHFVGPPIGQWDPGRRGLNVHASITVHGETTLTPYLARPHDQQLRDVLADLGSPGSVSRLVLVVGTSCTGKTRTLYEAVTAVLPDWPLTAPRTDSDLAQLLLNGIPAHTIVWLDELQDRLTKTPDGITAAKAILELLHDGRVGPILFAGTIWPTNRMTMQARPNAAEAGVGAGVVPALLAAATVIDVPECFTATDLADLSATRDPRLLKAIATAARVSHPQVGSKITQVLAGGTQLVERLHPPEGLQPPGEFSPAAKAVLVASADLRRVGMDNPLPRWAIEGAAPSYLKPPTNAPATTWLEAGLTEASEAARRDDSVIGSRVLDIHDQGVPALTPHWTTTGGTPVEAYDLHDYIFQVHVNGRPAAPTRHVVDQLCDTRLPSPLHLGGVSVVGEAIRNDVELAGRIGRAMSRCKDNDEFAAQLAEYLYRVPEGQESLDAFARSGANPVARSLAATTEAVGKTRPPEGWPRVDIAIIDDNSIFRFILTEGLRERWPNALFSQSDSVEAFLQRPVVPRLVIMDLFRPEVLRRIRGVRVVATAREAPVLVWSNEAVGQRVRAALKAGAAMVLNKDTPMEELLDAVAKLGNFG